jgi:iron-sulfur cluster repair protein YtfE (RIC family)
VDPAEVVAALEAHDARASGPADTPPTEPAALVDHIEAVHPAWVRETLPVLLHFTARVAKEEEFEADLHRHVHVENDMLFPAIRSVIRPA